jgi:hypothetical protein
MNRIIRRLFKQSKEDPFKHNKGLSSIPVAKWKKNTFAILVGLVGGLYVGQYFPDIYFGQLVPYLPDI